MKCSNTPECPYCGEPLRCPGVVINTDANTIAKSLEGTLYCENNKCVSRKVCKSKFRLDENNLIQEDI